MKKESILADVCLELLSAYSICFLIQVTLQFRDVGTESLCSIVLRDDCSAPLLNRIPAEACLLFTRGA